MTERPGGSNEKVYLGIQRLEESGEDEEIVYLDDTQVINSPKNKSVDGGGSGFIACHLRSAE